MNWVQSLFLINFIKCKKRKKIRDGVDVWQTLAGKNCYFRAAQTQLFQHLKACHTTVVLWLSGVQTAHFISNSGSVEPCARQINRSKPVFVFLFVFLLCICGETKHPSSMLSAEWEAVSHGSAGMPLSCGNSLWVPLASVLWQRIMKFTTSAIC